MVCIDDGSYDYMLSDLQSLALRDPRVRVIELSRNSGSEAALSTSIDSTHSDAIISIDSDLQDPPELIAEWQAGADAVLAKRTDRHVD